MARHVYPLHSIRLRQPVTAKQLTAALDSPEASTLRGALDLAHTLSCCERSVIMTRTTRIHRHHSCSYGPAFLHELPSQTSCKLRPAQIRRHGCASDHA